MLLPLPRAPSPKPHPSSRIISRGSPSGRPGTFRTPPRGDRRLAGTESSSSGSSSSLRGSGSRFCSGPRFAGRWVGLPCRDLTPSLTRELSPGSVQDFSGVGSPPRLGPLPPVGRGLGQAECGIFQRWPGWEPQWRAWGAPAAPTPTRLPSPSPPCSAFNPVTCFFSALINAPLCHLVTHDPFPWQPGPS